jgi:hexosaminidase
LENALIAAPHYAAFAAACLAGLAACSSPDSATGQNALQLIPSPASLELRKGSFTLTDGMHVTAADARAREIARYLIDLLARTRGVTLELALDPQAVGSIRLALGRPPVESPEGYQLTVAPDGIDVIAGDPRGLFYGAVSLWQLVTADGAERGPATIAALDIADAPRFAWRGFMLDSARHYQPPAFIRDLIDWMALHKLNVLHWHLTDDQGWRLEIRKYPLLTQVGAWRNPAGSAWPRVPDPATGAVPRYGGYYTQQEVREIVTYAASRFVTVVPEIEMPGHAQAAIASYPRLGTGGSAPVVSPDWGVHDYLFNVDESTIGFLEDVLAEVIELFPGEYIHVGGDEAVKRRWKESSRVQARMRELGVPDEAALQGWFVSRIERFLDARGRRLIGWDEILEGEIPARAAVMSWRGIEGAIQAARSGHDVVMAPAPVLYLDHLQSDSQDEPPGRPQVVTLRDIYEYEPVPRQLATGDAGRILGAQLNAWTEHMRLPERVIHQAFPRIAALAEVTWSPASARDWQYFLERVPVQFARYRRLGIDYADTAFQVRPRVSPGTTADQLRVGLSNQTQFGAIHYTLDGSMPSATSPTYAGPFEARTASTLRATAFAGELPLAADSPLVLGPQLLRRRTDVDLRQCTGNLVLRLEDDAPLEGNRAVFNVDIIDPCWIWTDADLTHATTVRVAVGQLPFNFQIGADADAIRRGDARTAEGELEIRIGGCHGEPAAILPLSAAAAATDLTVLPPARLPALAGRHDLCLRFARPAIHPIWAIQWIELDE